MNNIGKFILLICLFFFTSSAKLSAEMTYNLLPFSEEVELDGNDKESVWRSIPFSSSFNFVRNLHNREPRFISRFKAYPDRENIYFLIILECDSSDGKIKSKSVEELVFIGSGDASSGSFAYTLPMAAVYEIKAKITYKSDWDTTDDALGGTWQLDLVEITLFNTTKKFCKCKGIIKLNDFNVSGNNHMDGDTPKFTFTKEGICDVGINMAKLHVGSDLLVEGAYEVLDKDSWDLTEEELKVALGGEANGTDSVTKIIPFGNVFQLRDQLVLYWNDKLVEKGRITVGPGIEPASIGVKNVTTVAAKFAGKFKYSNLEITVGGSYNRAVTNDFSTVVGPENSEDPFTYQGIGYQLVRVMTNSFYERIRINKKTGDRISLVLIWFVPYPTNNGLDDFRFGIRKKCN